MAKETIFLTTMIVLGLIAIIYYYNPKEMDSGLKIKLIFLGIGILGGIILLIIGLFR